MTIMGQGRNWYTTTSRVHLCKGSALDAQSTRPRDSTEHHYGISIYHPSHEHHWCVGGAWSDPSSQPTVKLLTGPYAPPSLFVIEFRLQPRPCTPGVRFCALQRRGEISSQKGGTVKMIDTNLDEISYLGKGRHFWTN